MNNLKTLRKQHKKTIEQVIQHIGISKRSYIDYEKGVIEPYSFEMPDIFDEEIFEKEEEIKRLIQNINELEIEHKDVGKEIKSLEELKKKAFETSSIEDRAKYTRAKQEFEEQNTGGNE